VIRRVALGLFVSLLTLILIEGIASVGVFVWNTHEPSRRCSIAITATT
jgi:hypothetical protein